MKVRLETGEEAQAQRLEGNSLTLLSPRAFPPGSPIRFSTAEADEQRQFEGRTIGSKRAEEELFEVRLRFVNLRRRDRELLEQKLG